MPADQIRYTATARGLHWLSALVVIAMITAGLIMVRDGLPRGLQNTLFIFHKNMGVVALGLVAIRLAWRLTHRPPALDLPWWQARAAAVSHGLLYGLLFVLPLSGYTRVKAGGFPIEALDAMGVPSLVPRSDALAEIAKSVHYYAGLLLGAVIAIHIAAALYHALVRRDGVFRRMWPPVGRGADV